MTLFLNFGVDDNTKVLLLHTDQSGRTEDEERGDERATRGK